MGVLEAVAPAGGATINWYHEADAGDIAQAMERARAAFVLWSRTPVAERRGYLGALRAAIVGDLDAVVDCLVTATGKVRVEALASDIYPTLDSIRYYEKHVEGILRTRRAPTPLIFPHSSSSIVHKPAGVAAVVAPWNYPLQLALVPAVAALAAGCTVLLKPSEVTPSVGELIEGLCKKACLPDNVLQVLYGGGETGRLLIEAHPDRLFFTGSVTTGRQVAKACAERLIPSTLELGGKDPMIVFDDAPFERTVRGAVYGAFANSGQICVSVERLYVQDTIYERFLTALTDETRRVRVGAGWDAEIGSMTAAKQVAVVEEHLRDALAKGAKPLTEVRREGMFLSPVVLRDVTPDMKVLTEETFGPLLPVVPFSTEDEAVRLANGCVYGLNASVWTADLDKGRRVAAKLRAGNCAVNDVAKNIGNPYLPFGGVGQSGWGRYHAADGIYAFCDKMSLMVNTGAAGREINWFPYSRRLYDSLRTFLEVLYGRGGLVKKMKGVIVAADHIRKTAP